MTEIQPDVVDLIVQKVTERVAERLTAHFDGRHDALENRMAKLEQSIDVNASDIKHDTRYTRIVAIQAIKNLLGSSGQPETPDEDMPRPLDIDRAVAAHPSAGPQRVDLDRYGVVVYLRPGTNPAEAWEEVKADLRQERGAR